MVGLKSYTAYHVTVSDFGKTYSIERRFDDFQKLHMDLLSVDGQLPPLPEKRMFASTDAAVVAERRPAFERLLRYCLRSEEVACEQNQHLWKFLELPVAAMVVARYLFKTRRLKYLPQCSKVLEPKYEKDAYRLCHESVVKTNLFLLSQEGMLSANGVSDATQELESEVQVIEMIRYALTQGGDEVRRVFVEENGIAIMLRLLLRIANRKSAAVTPDEKVRKVLNALIHGEGENYPVVFASFLRKGGVSVLAGFKDLCAQHTAFSEFVGKALWLAWEPETQLALLEDEATAPEALALLGAIFGSSTKSSQILAALLMSCLIANGVFGSNTGRQEKAGAGIGGLVEELLLAMPTFLHPRLQGGAGETSASPGAPSRGPAADDVQNAEGFLASLGRNERAFARLLACVHAPCAGGDVVANLESPVWSASAFALWCLLKIQPKASRLEGIRPAVPLLARCGPPRVRWLVGELLLQLHVASAEEGGSRAGGAAQQEGSPMSQLGAEAAANEQSAVEETMAEQITHSMSQLEESLQQNRRVMVQQQQLATVRQQALALDGDGHWSAELNAALLKLVHARERLAKAAGSAQEVEAKSASSLANFATLLGVEAEASVADLEQALQSVREVEATHDGERDQLRELEGSLVGQTRVAEERRNEMEEADSAVAAVRKRIAEMEQELSSKQREAQQKRTLASSDMSSRRAQTSKDVEEIDKDLNKLREKAQRLSEAREGANSPITEEKAQEMMSQLKQQAAELKKRRAELQQELQQVSMDPAVAQDLATKLEQEATQFHEHLNFVRTSELQELERNHVARREAWQQETTQLQEIRAQRDSYERKLRDLRRQLDERWAVWQRLWSARLGRWHERARALSEAQLTSHCMGEIVSTGWDAFHDEEAARQEVLQAVATAQENLAALAQQLSAVDQSGQ